MRCPGQPSRSFLAVAAGTAGQGTAAGLWHRPALVIFGTSKGSAVLDFASAAPVPVFLSAKAPCRAQRQSFDLLLCYASDCSQPRGLRTGMLHNFAVAVGNGSAASLPLEPPDFIKISFSKDFL